MTSAAQPPLTHEWNVGDIRIVRVSDDDFALPSDTPVPPWAVPDLAPSTAETRVAFTALAIESAGTRVIVDPWLANDFPRDGDTATAHAERLFDHLATLGFAADDVDVVANTHLDGIGWNTRPDGAGGWRLAFPNARYLYPAGGVAAIEAGEEILGDDGFRTLTGLTNVEPVTEATELAPGVTMVDAPGHDAGHCAIRIADGDDLAIYPGHLVLNVFDIDDPTAEAPGDPRWELSVSTRTAILGELAERRGLLLTTLLGGSGAGRVVRTDDAPTAAFALRSAQTPSLA